MDVKDIEDSVLTITYKRDQRNVASIFHCGFNFSVFCQSSMLRDTWNNDSAVARAARGAALGALAGSLFNRPGTGAVVGGLLGFGGGSAVREAVPSDVHGSCVILFYAPWCPACTRFRSNVFPHVPAELAKRGRSDLPVLQIDIKHNPGLDITGKVIRSIPTVVFIDAAKRPHVFEGPMTASAIVDFATSSEAIVLHAGASMALGGGSTSAPKSPKSRTSPSRHRKGSARRRSPRLQSPRKRNSPRAAGKRTKRSPTARRRSSPVRSAAARK